MRLRWSHLGAVVVLTYGALTVALGVFELVVHLTIAQTIQGGIFVAIGLLAIAGGTVWIRQQRGSSR